MTTITINTYDPAGRFNMDDDEAKAFFNFVEKEAIEAGFDVVRTCAIDVDPESEEFMEKTFQNYNV
ncbi:hypothetical protein A9G48_01140 [Gilliamella sp. wkB18]|uniref:hypothetical protein n=1 Tax=Gilliamella sp. wkB18 TaxID=3120260 RepID=UPI00080E84EA|nr:hypothetical protein [Gilliamella apicola]OCG65005.1 hypothetical protein A9G48_01140 [Gilliamella apicola]